MDLLYQKYASPFDYMDSLLAMGQLENGIKRVIEQENEDKMWQLYLHSLPYVKESFIDWKKSMTKPQAQELTEEEIKVQIDKADNILKSFQLERG